MMYSNERYEDAGLVQRLRRGDTAAFIEIYNRYHGDIYNYLLRFVKLPEMAEDIMQDVFLKVWSIREKINPELSFLGYLYRISRNQAFKALKKIAADKDLRLRVLLEFSHTVEGTDNKAGWDQYEKILMSAIDSLPAQRRKIFKLCREEGKTYKQVSCELNISPNTVKEHMVLATRSIREYFYRYGDITLLAIFIANC